MKNDEKQAKQSRASEHPGEKRGATERPLFRLSTDAVRQLGLEAVKARDQAQLDQCMAELQGRASQRSGEAEEELRAAAGTLLKPYKPLHAGGRFSIDPSQLRDVTVVTDDAIVHERAQMVSQAKLEVWLSSYIWGYADPLTSLLCKKAKEDGVSVRVIISSGPCNSEHVKKHIKLLEGAGVVVYCSESSHSKCVVVDGEDVLLGSANVDRSHRDLSLRAKGKPLAESVRAYLIEVATPTRRQAVAGDGGSAAPEPGSPTEAPRRSRT